MTELKSVDEIMSMVCRYGDNCLFRIPTGNALTDIRAVITDLHTAATREQPGPTQRLLDDPAEDEAWKDL